MKGDCGRHKKCDTLVHLTNYSILKCLIVKYMNLKHDEKAYVSTSTGQEPSENKITFNLYVASGDSWWCRWFYKNTSVSSLLELFLNTVENYGLPSRVRSDKGKKNVDVA